jgi:hypothetical protein
MLAVRNIDLVLYYENGTETCPQGMFSFDCRLGGTPSPTGLVSVEFDTPPDIIFAGKTYTPFYTLDQATDVTGFASIDGQNRRLASSLLTSPTPGRTLLTLPADTANLLTGIGTVPVGQDIPDPTGATSTFPSTSVGGMVWPVATAFDPYVLTGVSTVSGMAVYQNLAVAPVGTTPGWYAFSLIQQPWTIRHEASPGYPASTTNYLSFATPQLVYCTPSTDYVQLQVMAEQLVEPLTPPAFDVLSYYSIGDVAGLAQLYVCPPGSSSFVRIPATAITLLGRNASSSVYNIDMTAAMGSNSTLPSWAVNKLPCGIGAIGPIGV